VRIVTYRPARKIRKSGRKVVGKFPSSKMGRMITWESPVERDYLYLVEFDVDVISFWEQPLIVRYYDDTDHKIHRYTPDILVIRKGNRKQVVEVKDEKTAQSEEYQRLFQRVGPILQREGYEFIVATDRMIRIQPLLRNLKLLQKYAKVRISNNHLICLNNLFACRKEIPLGEVMTLLGSKRISKQEVFALLRHGILSVNLRHEINGDSAVSFAINSTDERR